MIILKKDFSLFIIIYLTFTLLCQMLFDPILFVWKKSRNFWNSILVANWFFLSLQVLICTDVASRGLDIPGVQLVLNHNVPNDPKVRNSSQRKLAWIFLPGGGDRKLIEGMSLLLLPTKKLFSSYFYLVNCLVDWLQLISDYL